MTNWGIYRGEPGTHGGIDNLPDPPPWRKFPLHGEALTNRPPESKMDATRAESYRPTRETVELVNAALYLRRPMLVSGPPGSGKSTLAYSIAHELELGRVLHWPITSQVSAADGLYAYDPLARLYAASQRDARAAVARAGHPGAAADASTEPPAATPEDIGEFITLGPLGTALLPWEKPRVLLIDEIDKGDLDLPNDLLTIFEEGKYEISQLARQADLESTASPKMSDSPQRVEVRNGAVQAYRFPIVVMTSNAEREFPHAFLRRCIRINISLPDNTDDMTEIVSAHLGERANDAGELIESFVARAGAGEDLSTDQLLNAIYLVHEATGLDAAERTDLANRIMVAFSQTRRSV